MAFYKKVKQKGDDKWHPRAVTKGHPYTTDEIARLLSEMSTVTPGDTYAVLMNLGEVLGKLMSSGHSVKLKGIGTFYYVTPRSLYFKEKGSLSEKCFVLLYPN